LAELYVKTQTARGKESAKDASNLLKNHVFETEFASLPARDLTPDNVTDLLRAILEQGKARTAAKVRSYLHAAYAMASRARTDANAPLAAKAFGITTNPIAATQIDSGIKPRDVVLTETELAEAMRVLAGRRAKGYDDALAAIELSILLGGQRVRQVARLNASDVDLDARTVSLWDSKGRRKAPRKHVVPLTDAAAKLVKLAISMKRGDGLFGDGAQLSPGTLAHKGSEFLAEVQAKLKQSKRPKIQARDLRRTCETQLAALGISRDVRAQLLSHGLSGVQQVPYDQHSWLPEKRAALEAWGAHLEALATRRPMASNVKRLNRAAPVGPKKNASANNRLAQNLERRTRAMTSLISYRALGHPLPRSMGNTWL